MSDFNEFMHYRVLAFKYSLRNEELTDKIINESGDQIPLRNVCAKLSPELADRLDSMVSVLGISKRPAGWHFEEDRRSLRPPR